MNNKKKLVIITGITMAGKSSTAKELVKQLQTAGVAAELLKETTTRPKRESDYQNPEYYFTTNDDYELRDFYVSIDFNVTGGEVWRYGIEVQDLPEVGIIASNMYAVDKLLENNSLPDDVELIVFYLDVSEEEVLKRSKGDRASQKGDDVMDRIRRDIGKYNEYYRKHEGYIFHVPCDELNLEGVVDYICYILRKGYLGGDTHCCGKCNYEPKGIKIKTFIVSLLIAIILTYVGTSWMYDYLINEGIITLPVQDTVELEECPLCDGTAELNPVNDSYYIECKKCGLQTAYYGSLDMLVNYWNDRQ